jgi:hypothetical protein
MARRIRALAVVLAGALVALAGCGSAVTSQQTETPLTPVAVPTDSPTAGATERPTTTPSAAVPEPRYLDLRPTCERPPGLVVAIQVGALRNDPPGSNAGIDATWRFAAPSNRRAVGSLDRFVEVIERGYQPLLDAETVTYGPLERGDGSASRLVTVRAGNRTATYRWELERQADGPLAGCWLTTAVLGVEGTARERPTSTVEGLPRA